MKRMITKDEQGELKIYRSRIQELQTCKSPTVNRFCKLKLSSCKGPLGSKIASVWRRRASCTSPKHQSPPRRSESIRSDVLCPLFLLICFTEFILLQFSSVAQSCPTLCDPMNCSMPDLPVHHQLPEFTHTHVH